MITRNINFENALLMQPSRVVDRRRSAQAQPLHPQPSRIVDRRFSAKPQSSIQSRSIPIGARGRPRSSILFIGMRPRLDNLIPPAQAAVQQPALVPAQDPVPVQNQLTRHLTHSIFDTPIHLGCIETLSHVKRNSRNSKFSKKLMLQIQILSHNYMNLSINK